MGNSLIRLGGVGFSWVKALPREFANDLLEVRPPHVPGCGWKDVVPDRCEAAEQLRDPSWAGHEPPVQVFGAVAPSANVNPADVPDRAHRSFDARDQNPELRGKTFWEVARLRIVLTGLEQDDDGKAVRLSRAKAPTFVRP